MENSNDTTIVFYGLSTCIHCKHARDFLDAKGVNYELHLVDESSGEERSQILRKIKEYNPRISFPTIVFNNGKVVVGEDTAAINKALEGILLGSPKEQKKKKEHPPFVREVMERLALLQQKKGYLFNNAEGVAEDLIEQLLQCKDKFGYMCCPCRLASGNKECDQDIICPCEYRSADVKEYGVCFCGLYVGEDTSQCPKKGQQVPDRRPAEKVWKDTTS